MTLLPTFHECAADRAIVRTVRAADIREAAAKLGRLPHGHYVISAASHACGYVRALPSDRCPCCGVRQRKAGMPECERCASERLALRRSGFAGPAAGPQRVRVPAAESRAVKGVATARRRQVAALYAELGNTAEVARQLGVTKQAVSLLLRQSGVEVRRRRGARSGRAVYDA